MMTTMLGVAFAMGQPAGGAAQGGGASAMMNLVPLIFMFGIFYLLLIRPQQKKAKEHRAMIDALKTGDSVKTASGIHGRIASIDDQVITLEVATGVKIKVDKPYITSVVK